MFFYLQINVFNIYAIFPAVHVAYWSLTCLEVGYGTR